MFNLNLLNGNGFNPETVNRGTNWLKTFASAFWGLLGAVLSLVCIGLLFRTIPMAMHHGSKKEWKECILYVLASIVVLLLGVGGAIIAINMVQTIFGSTGGQKGGADLNMALLPLFDSLSIPMP